MNRKMRIAIILTCYNRKVKTLSCLQRLSMIYTRYKGLVEIKVFVTDDNSPDGTYMELTQQNYSFPMVVSLGNGSLFWAGGMNLSWEKAVKEGSFDGYMWLNDDTVLNDQIFEEIIEVNKYSISRYGKSGIYVGSTCSFQSESEFTYGGRIFSNRLLNTLRPVYPSEQFQQCELANGNITYIAHEVVESIGVLYKEYQHCADYDYTYLAYKKGFPILSMRGWLGKCDDDHQHEGYTRFLSLPLKARARYLYSSKGLGFHDALLFQRRFFPYRYPVVLLFGWIKVLFPNAYLFIKRYFS